jgi:hypothetical protein
MSATPDVPGSTPLVREPATGVLEHPLRKGVT